MDGVRGKLALQAFRVVNPVAEDRETEAVIGANGAGWNEGVHEGPVGKVKSLNGPRNVRERKQRKVVANDQRVSLCRGGAEYPPSAVANRNGRAAAALGNNRRNAAAATLFNEDLVIRISSLRLDRFLQSNFSHAFDEFSSRSSYGFPLVLKLTEA